MAKKKIIKTESDMDGTNPIVDILKKAVVSGKITFEKICVIADMPYPTLMSCLRRNSFSKKTIQILKYKGLISSSDAKGHDKWKLDQRKEDHV